MRKYARKAADLVRRIHLMRAGNAIASQDWRGPLNGHEAPNALAEYFKNNRSGHGIWKWEHYFSAYDRHLSKFRGTVCHIMEVGIYSGGSLGMWRSYFGNQASIYGVDLQPECLSYEKTGAKVFIGDQADRSFWSKVKKQTPHLDILIDDGGHKPEQQIVTLEEILPHLAPGGVYICEDIHGSRNDFLFYLAGLTINICENEIGQAEHDNERRIWSPASEFQKAVCSIHQYPFMTVIEKRETELKEFVAPKRGTEWQPFLT